MPISDVRITGYRSIRSIAFPLRQLTVLVGANGVGKTNLYRALQLLQAAALGTLAEEIAAEGGLASVSWAGERTLGDKPRLTLSVDVSDDGHPTSRYQLELGYPATRDPDLADVDAGRITRYQFDIGFPVPTAAAFPLEAQIKSESLTVLGASRPLMLMERKGRSVWARNDKGARVLVDDSLLPSETALSRLRGGFPELDVVRFALSSWRFYHGFRTDAASPLRRPSPAFTTPMLAEDGSNLAAVFATLRHIREETSDLDSAIGQAFPGAVLNVFMPEDNASFSMTFAEFPKRPFAAHELSDGTLHFLALMGALLSYRLPPFIALNEPEASLHPDLLPALARIIGVAAQRTQVWVVTHSQLLADALAAETGALPRQVIRQDGGTWLEGLNTLGAFADD